MMYSALGKISQNVCKFNTKNELKLTYMSSTQKKLQNYQIIDLIKIAVIDLY